MTCGSAPRGGCDFDPSHEGPCSQNMTDAPETPEEALVRIAYDAYDPEVFGTVDLAQIRAVLEAAGYTLDSVSATIIRIMMPRVAGMLAAEGYRIVHPDDVPVKSWATETRDSVMDQMAGGWNECRALVFGEGT